MKNIYSFLYISFFLAYASLDAQLVLYRNYDGSNQIVKDKVSIRLMPGYSVKAEVVGMPPKSTSTLYRAYIVIKELDNTENVTVLGLITNTCVINIPLVQQLPYGNYLSLGKCFTYSASGNYESATDCTITDSPPPPPNGYDEYQLEQIESAIQLYPNPTTSLLNISWTGMAVGKITGISAISVNGGWQQNIPINTTQTTTQFNLPNQPNGVYIVKIQLNTGQFISKNVLKL